MQNFNDLWVVDRTMLRFPCCVAAKFPRGHATFSPLDLGPRPSIRGSPRFKFIFISTIDLYFNIEI